MSARQMPHGFHVNLTGGLISEAVFIAALIAVSVIGAGFCELIPWR
jgi:hypothetical protein